MVQMPYTKPILTQFGKVTELTHGGSRGGSDGGGNQSRV